IASNNNQGYGVHRRPDQEGNNDDRGQRGYRDREWQSRLSAKDQHRFDTYYSRWLEARETVDRHQTANMEKRMRALMARYCIPPATRSRRYDSGEGIAIDAATPWSRHRALLRKLEPGQHARWLRPRSQDSRRRMELLFHGCRSKGDVLWRCRGDENRERIAADLQEDKTATLQCSRDHRNRPEAFSWCALYDRFGTLAPYPTELLLE